MYQPTHRIKAEEKRLFHRFLITTGAVVVSIVLVLYAGLPILAKIIAFFTPTTRNQLNTNVSSLFLLPPSLDPTFEATNSSSVTISGFGDKEATVKIFVNGREITKVKTDSDGRFLAKKISLKEGDNNITAKTVKDQKESSPSSVLHIIYKNSRPSLEITQPEDNARFSGDSKEITISGETEADNRVTINDRLAIVDTQGIFSYKVSLNEGENKFKIIVTDQAGNITDKEIKVTYNP